MISHFTGLLHYEWWALRKVLQVIKQVETPEDNDKIILLFSHIILAQKVWLQRISGETPLNNVWNHITLAEMESALEENMSGYKNFFINSSGKGIEQEVSYVNMKGISFSSKVTDILQHLAFHSAYHRGQIIQLLKETGVPLPHTDYIVFCRETESSNDK